MDHLRDALRLSVIDSRRLRRYGPVLAALLAAAAALPGLRLPFLADDWANLAVVSAGLPGRTPFGYFRPLYLASYRLDQIAWGLSPSLFHLTNLVLIGVATALVVVLSRRYTGDVRLAALAGVLFALHPYHVENAAWIAARSDPLFSVFLLWGALAYDRWRTGLRGVPVTTLVLFAAALLAKETAIVLPAFLLVVGWIDRTRRPAPREWARGYLPLVGLGLVHFLWLRPLALGGMSLDVLGGFGTYWVKKLLGFGAAAVLPAHTEVLEDRTALWGALALAAAAALIFAARAVSGRIPATAWAAAAMFVVLLGPSLVSFQERYFFLPGAASSLALASLLRASGRRVGLAAGVVLVCGWLVASEDHWAGWSEARIASTRVVDDLVRASRAPGVAEIVVANMPHRVRGAPIAGDFSAAVAISGGRTVEVIPATYVDYTTARADALDGPSETAIQRPPPRAAVRLRIGARRYSRLVWPPAPRAPASLETDAATIDFEASGAIRVLIDPAPGRAAYVWSAGRLDRLF